ncbi:hypothetical protein F0A16_02740 [Salinicola corii]|uniref:Tail tubular protein A n=1 Tax=Salinicola corii TaxID=2606937 RepID=A0A640WJ98_9GAMM|nr:hypothetical protein [Salinicola corii]KAA0020723.1 hypothetical protein F0A16_02740 [Salinicola corii]
MDKTAIANMALSSIISTRTITSMDDGSVDATQLRLWYEPTLEHLLRQHRWGFAIKFRELAQATVGTPGFRFTYTYPDDCISIHKIVSPCGRWQRHSVPFKTVALEDRKGIACDLQHACIEYTCRPNEAFFSGDFVQAFVAALASRIAMPITSNAKLYQAKSQEAQLLLSNAKTNDLGEQYPEPELPSKYDEARRLYGDDYRGDPWQR